MTVTGVGIGIPGIMDQATGIVPFCSNLAWHSVPLVKLMQKAGYKVERVKP